jgi:nucleolar GTP-binding protein
MNLKLIEKPDVLLEASFSRARKKAGAYAKQKTPFYTIKGKEIAKIEAPFDYLESTLLKVVKDFPSVDKLEPFYKDLFTFVIDVNETKIALAKVSATVRIIKNMRREKIIALKEIRYEKGAVQHSKNLTREYFGRVSSLIKKLKGPISIYNDAARKLRELPSIKADQEAYILAGFPNVGKSTLMGKITTSTPKTAAYPFTTKGLNVGSFIKKYLPIQVIDTPGLLDRPISKRNNIELKAISAFQHLKGTIIFVVDPLQEMAEQQNLFAEIKKLFSDKGFIIVINKTDVASDEQIKKAQKAFEGNFVILEGEGLDNLSKELLK